MPGIPLKQLLEGTDGVLAGQHLGTAAPVVVGVAILDPDDEPRDHHGELVLIIGARGRESLPLLRAAARGGAVAVAVKPGPSGAADELVSAGIEAGVMLLVVRPQARWDQLVMLLRERLDVHELESDPDHRIHPSPPGALAPPGAGLDHPGGDLFALAEATALVTGGIVSIEDAGSRVLAYSRSADEVDELRRLSILGWRGPEGYLAMLREWGVFDRLRAGEQVVRVEEHPELGIRARLAVGVRAGSRYLGTIWVQQRAEPFAVQAEDALVGAARLVAAEILRRRSGANTSHPDALVDLLTGRVNTDLLAGRLGLDPAGSAVVIGFAGPVEPDVAARELYREQARDVVSLYATAYHRAAMVAVVDDRVYAVLPSGVAQDRVDASVLTWVRQAVAVLATRAGAQVRAGIGLPARSLAGVLEARSEADRVLDALARPRVGPPPAPAVATITELRAEVLLAETLDLLAQRPELSHPGVRALVEHDLAHGGELVSSVLAHLDALGDVRAGAAALHVHPNTLRYRLRRARELSGIDLDDPRERLACHLQLLLANRRR
ncbi:MAG: helix-turn-helix domain-containing protein [Pseudonocardia sp.]|nr:helix-turn-helix domain-containing protein [Pseudonocardia sp.]